MIELSTQTRVAELEARSPAMLAALKSSGMFKDGDSSITLGELCMDFGLHPQIILNMLARAGLNDPPPDIDISELEGLSLPDIVSHVETVHHQTARETLPGTIELVRNVVAAHGQNDARLHEVQSLFEKMATELEDHMVHEEGALFPMCRDMAQLGTISATPCGDRVGGPIQCMTNDHDQAKKELAQLSALTDGFVAPAGADAQYADMLQRLQAFAEDLALHIHKEDHLLFPRALEMQASLRESRQL